MKNEKKGRRFRWMPKILWGTATVIFFSIAVATLNPVTGLPLMGVALLSGYYFFKSFTNDLTGKSDAAERISKAREKGEKRIEAVEDARIRREKGESLSKWDVEMAKWEKAIEEKMVGPVGRLLYVFSKTGPWPTTIVYTALTLFTILISFPLTIILALGATVGYFKYLRYPRAKAGIFLAFVIVGGWPALTLTAGPVILILSLPVLWRMASSSDKDVEGTQQKMESLQAARNYEAEPEEEEKKNPDEEIDEIADILSGHDIGKSGSFENPKRQEIGFTWTRPTDLWVKSRGKKVYLDNFAFSDEILLKAGVADDPGIVELAREAARIEGRLDPLDLTRTLLFVGAMGSGKTEAINTLLAQNFYNRAIINDVKGDFTEKFYDPERDILFNLFDKRSKYWDLFEEMKYNPEVAIAFVKNLIKASVSDKKEGDFWTNQAAKIVTDSIIKHAFDPNSKDLHSSEKWARVVRDMEAYRDSAGDDKTKSSIALTMELSLELFKLTAYRAKDAEPFTITEFFNRQDGQKLFLLNNPAYSTKLTPYITGFLGAFTAMMLGRSDTKEDFTFIVLDEFYSLPFDSDTKRNLLTMVRSKGGQLLLGTQFIRTKNDDDKQLIESSRFATVVFKLSDNETIKRLIDMTGEVTYKEAMVSRSQGSGQQSMDRAGGALSGFGPGLPLVDSRPVTWNKSDQHRKIHFLDPKKLSAVPKYHHITLIPEEHLFYLGYTRLTKLEKSNQSFDPIDMAEWFTYAHLGSSGSAPAAAAPAAAPTGAEEELPAGERERFKLYWILRFGKDDEAEEVLSRLDIEAIKELYSEFEDEIDLKEIRSLPMEEKLEVIGEISQVEDPDELFDILDEKGMIYGCSALYEEEEPVEETEAEKEDNEEKEETK